MCPHARTARCVYSRDVALGCADCEVLPRSLSLSFKIIMVMLSQPRPGEDGAKHLWCGGCDGVGWCDMMCGV